MATTKHNPPHVYPQYSNYSHAVEVSANSRLLFISGLNGFQIDGKSMPDTFFEQGDIIWQHLGSILKSAGMNYSNLVSLRIYLANPEYDEENVRLEKYLGTHEVALTVICAQLLEPAWKIELEAVASA